MKLNLHKNMAAEIDRAKSTVDFYFNELDAMRQRNRHVNAAHGIKMIEATTVISGGEAGPLISGEAEIEGLDVEEMARRIIEAHERREAEIIESELARRRVITLINKASSPAEVQAALETIGISDAQQEERRGRGELPFPNI